MAFNTLTFTFNSICSCFYYVKFLRILAIYLRIVLIFTLLYQHSVSSSQMTKKNTLAYTDSLKGNFDQIYILYYARMHRFAKQYVLTDEDAENIVQDVFLLLWERKNVLDIQINLVSYIFSLVKNKCLDFLRHQCIANEVKQELFLKLSALEELNHTMSSEDDIERIVREAIDKLPERCRLIFLKSRIEGKKYKEIADELSISVNTVENQMAIALRKLRIELKDYLPLFFFLINC